jgi:hypothetical protein
VRDRAERASTTSIRALDSRHDVKRTKRSKLEARRTCNDIVLYQGTDIERIVKYGMVVRQYLEYASVLKKMASAPRNKS